MPAVSVKNLTKQFHELCAVNNISFDINQGEVFGLLGPNGAGKTTTISMLSTMLKPTSGTATINGYDIIKDPDNVRKSIGIVFQDPSLDEDLTAYENLDLHGRLYGVPKNVRKQKIIELLKLVELDNRKNDLVKTFSGGMKRRLEIARGLLHDPKVLFLDEPTIGLDPQTRNHLWTYIEKLSKEKNITIILTTHYMDEADRLCGRVAIIDHGKIIALNTPSYLKNEIGGDVIVIRASNIEKLYSLLKQPWIKNVTKHDELIYIHLKDAEKHVVDIVNLANKNNIEIKSLSINKPSLEDVFLHFTGKTIREQEASAIDNIRIRRRARNK